LCARERKTLEKEREKTSEKEKKFGKELLRI